MRLDHIFLVPDSQNGALETVPSELAKRQFQEWAARHLCHSLGSISNNTPQPKAGAATEQERIGQARHTPLPAHSRGIYRTPPRVHTPLHGCLYWRRQTERTVASSAAPSKPVGAPA